MAKQTVDLSDLSRDGKAAVRALKALDFNEVLKVFMAPQLAAQIAAAAKTSGVEQLDKALSSLKQQVIDALKQAFLDKYSVKVLSDGPHQVSLTIPKGKRWMDLINDAHDLAQHLYNRPGVVPRRLDLWRNDRKFTQVVTKATPVAVEGCVPNSTNMRRDEHESPERNWNNVDIRDLAAAQQAFFIATGRDLFDGNIVRARGGALLFDSLGLVVASFFDDGCRYRYVAASRSLPLPNKKLDR